ncbi:hypothetical protein RDI58_022536 [Solanum bulbocastanum]|uniref:Uncharacterized protein n=1 Tax=Solanum bulbocastanum TaxID=147425 RepID=A0AAN8T809_SOLBU
MMKKSVLTPIKSPRLVEATSTDEVHAPTFNILTQTPPPKNNEISTKGCSSQSKISQAKKTAREVSAIFGTNTIWCIL